jgi:hypothetical protein
VWRGERAKERRRRKEGGRRKREGERERGVLSLGIKIFQIVVACVSSFFFLILRSVI